MPHYCTNCGINWARLHSKDAGDSMYEYCPICKTDSFLDAGKPGESFIKLITGEVISPKTGEQFKRFPEVSIESEQEDEPDFFTEHMDLNDERMNREDMALEMYQQALAAGMLEEEAKAIYRAKMAKG